MYILEEENKDLRRELGQLRVMNADEQSAKLQEENQNLKRRNGALLIECEDAKMKLRAAKKELERNQAYNAAVKSGKNPAQKTQEEFLAEMKRGPVVARPQTAAAGVIAKLGTNEEVSDDLYLAAQDELDRELAELIEKNKKAMDSLNQEVREVSRVVAEEKTPTIV